MTDLVSAAALGRATVWAREVGLQSFLRRSVKVEDDPAGGHAFQLAWKALERNGTPRMVRVAVDNGFVSSPRSFAHWSHEPTPVSQVLVLPDIVTLWRWTDAIAGRDVTPFVMVAPVGGRAVPPEWHDSEYWEFASVTVLADELLDPSPTVSALIESGSDVMGVAMPHLGCTWTSLGAADGLDVEAFQAIVDRSAPTASFRRILHRDWARDAIASPARSLDLAQRLCRSVGVEDCDAVDGSRSIVVRSDRTCSQIIAVPSRPRSRAGAHHGVTVEAWGERSVAEFLRGGRVAGDRLGDRLDDLLLLFVGRDVAGLRWLAGFVAMTYFYQALDDLPLVLVRGGTAGSRLAVRRTLASLCHAPTVTARARAAQFARIADAAPGTLILEEPGVLCGPSGSTEIGRFVESGLVRDASAYTSMTGATDLRCLDVFGPKLVISGTVSANGLGCTVYDVDLGSGLGAPTSPISSAVSAEVRDMLHIWSMDAFARLRASLGAQASASAVLPAILDDLFGARDGRADASGVAQPTTKSHRSGYDVAPARRMQDILGRCVGGDWLSMVQVMLEIALVGGDDASYSPERVGRWLAARPEIDSTLGTERRRLHGQISRIYPLISPSGSGRADASSAFNFCLGRVCGDCPYEPVCETNFPGMRKVKNRRPGRS